MSLEDIEVKKCALCGKEFMGRKNQKFCSLRCSWKVSSRAYYLKKKGIKEEVMKNTILKCPVCGKEFTAKRANQKYCCTHCTWKASARAKYRRDKEKRLKNEAAG